MTLQERSDLVLTFARVLRVNGQSTDETMAAAERLSNDLDLHATIIARWGELQLQARDGGARLVSVEAADPTGVDMDRVASAMRTVDEVGAGRLAQPAVLEAISAISDAPPAPTWLFTLAAAAGAAAPFGRVWGPHPPAGAPLLAAAAGGGAPLRPPAPHHTKPPPPPPLP